MALARLDVASMTRTGPEDFQRLYWWDNVATTAILVPIRWFVSIRLQSCVDGL